MRQGKSGQLDGPYPARSDESAIIRGDQWPVNQAAPAVKYQAPPPLFPSSPDLFLFTIFVSPTIASTNNVINPSSDAIVWPAHPQLPNMTEPLTKVDSAVQGLSSSPPKEKGHRRQSSSVPGVMNINDMEKDGIELAIAVETQKTGWKINSSPSSIDEPAMLKLHLTKPPVKKIDLRFPLGLEVTARNMKGVTIKDALDAIHKSYKKRSDDELDKPYLQGFEWDKEESWTRLIVHLGTVPATGGFGSGGGGGGKKKKKNKEEE